MIPLPKRRIYKHNSEELSQRYLQGAQTTMMSMMKCAMIPALAFVLSFIGTANTANAQVYYRIVDAGDMPLNLDNDQNMHVTLTRIDPGTTYSRVVAACSFQPVGAVWPNEGCTSNYGDGTIVTEHTYNQQTGLYDSAPLNSGRYDLMVSASGKLLARRSFVYAAGNFLSLGTIRMQNSPVRASLESSYLQDLPVNGGTFRVSVKLEHNVDYVDTGFAVMVNGTITGPAITAHHQQYGLESQKFNVMPGQPQTFTSQEITVPAEIPNGSWYCVNVYVNHPQRTGVVYASVSGCAVKGVNNMAYLPSNATQQ
jgi:hypothetical protein